ncbi:MAG: hypothetical protein KAH30_00595 [Caldisericia bacterium]|nr:hypothetical protein [Caldisericia bacterium]
MRSRRTKQISAGLIVMLVMVIFFVPQTNISQAKSNPSSWSLGLGILKSPVDVAVTGGIVFVSDSKRESVVSLDHEGNFIDELKVVDGKKINPAGIHCSEDSILYVTDPTNNRVLILTPNFDVINILEKDDLKVSNPIDIAVGNYSYIYVLSSTERKISVLTTHGEYLHTISSPGVLSGQITSPRGISVYGGRVAIADLGAGKVKVISQRKGEEVSYGIPGTYPGSLSGPIDTTWDNLGNLYVVDRNNNDVVIFPKIGLEPFSWGRYGRVGEAVDFFFSDMEPRDFSSAPGRLCRPSGIFIKNDCMFVADTGNGRILVTSVSDVWRVPRVPHEFFMAQKLDMPSAIVSPEFLDFGVVSDALTKKVSLEFTNCPGSIGTARISGDKNISVEPKIFVGSNVELRITVKNNVKPGRFNSTLSIESFDKKFTVKITGIRGENPGLVFTNECDNQAVMTGDGAYIKLELQSQNSFKGEVELSTSLPVYRPPWAKYATSKDEIQLTTIGMNFGKSIINLPANSKEVVLLTLYQSGRLRSGLYAFDVKATSKTNPAITTNHMITLFIKSKATGVTHGTVLLETFTAHWCNPCGFHREAQYRLAEEYGRRHVLPVAYHVMDEEDETGMTTDLNFSRFKMYGGAGVPLSLMNGKKLNISGNGDKTVRYAHDRIRGRKYSGTTFEYWKLRAELNASPKINPLILQFSATHENNTGTIFLRIKESDRNKGRQAKAFFLLIEDGIDYFSSNGEIQHNYIVRDFLTRDSSDEAYTPVILGRERIVNFDYILPVLPDGYQMVYENLSVIAFVQDEKTKNILGVHWYDLSAPMFCESELFTSGDKTLHRGVQSTINIHLSNTGTCIRPMIFEVKTSQEYMEFKLENTNLLVAPGETKTSTMYLSARGEINVADDLFIVITATDDSGDKLEYKLDLRGK